MDKNELEETMAWVKGTRARHRTRALEASQAEEPFAWADGVSWHKPAHRAVMASVNLGRWMSAALDDPKVCEEMKADIREWFSAGEPMETLCQALTTPTRIEASQPQEAVRKPWYCELPDSVHAEVTKQVREIQAIAIRLDDQKIQVVAEAVYNALIAAAALTPPQAAESGLLDERAAIVAFLREQDKLEGVTYSDYAWAADAIERGAHHPAKAGKPGEAGNGED